MNEIVNEWVKVMIKMDYVLLNKRAGVFLLGLKPRARSASGFRPNKTRPASLLNVFKHDYKFNRYTALLVFFI